MEETIRPNDFQTPPDPKHAYTNQVIMQTGKLLSNNQTSKLAADVTDLPILFIVIVLSLDMLQLLNNLRMGLLQRLWDDLGARLNSSVILHQVMSTV